MSVCVYKDEGVGGYAKLGADSKAWVDKRFLSRFKTHDSHGREAEHGGFFTVVGRVVVRRPFANFELR